MSPGSTARRLGGSEKAARSRAAQVSKSHASAIWDAWLASITSGKFGERHAAAGADETAGLGDGLAIFGFGRGVADARGGRQIGFLSAGKRYEIGVGLALDERVVRQFSDDIVLAAMAEGDLAAALDRVEEAGQLKRLKCVARRHDAIDDVACDEAVETGDIDIGESRSRRAGRRRVQAAAGWRCGR